MTLLYLSGPIDKANPADHGWIDTACLNLLDLRPTPVLFIPMRAFVAVPPFTPDNAAAIVNVNRSALADADAMVLRYVPGVETWGCQYELELALKMLKPVVIITDELAALRRSVYLTHLARTVPAFATWTDLVPVLSKLLADQYATEKVAAHG